MDTKLTINNHKIKKPENDFIKYDLKKGERISF
jgi:hypothetical protein